MGRMQRRKGATFERLVVTLFRRVYPEAKRGIGQARAADEVPDVDVPGWWPECKHGIGPSWRAALKQALAASKQSKRTPIVVTRDNGGPIMVHMPIETFLDVLKLAKERAEELGVPIVDRGWVVVVGVLCRERLERAGVPLALSGDRQVYAPAWAVWLDEHWPEHDPTRARVTEFVSRALTELVRYVVRSGDESIVEGACTAYRLGGERAVLSLLNFAGADVPPP